MSRRVIYKFPLRQQGDFYLEIPEGSRILGARVQRNQPVLYALCNPKAAKVRRKFRAMLTGEEFITVPPDAPIDTPYHVFIDTFVLYKGDFVAHLFEVVGG